MLQKYQGCFLGLAIGDALGLPTEFLSLAQIHQAYGPTGVEDLMGCHGFPPGTFTDDTQMSIALAEALLAADGSDLDTQMQAVARRFVAWAGSPENNRAPGNTCMSACRRLAEGASWRESGVAGSKGCGTAMRTAPIGLLYHRDQTTMLRVAIASSQITHGHPCALAGGVATALAVSLALDNTPPLAILETVVEVCQPISTEFAAHVARVPALLGTSPAAAMVELGEAWVAEEAIACALYCFLRTPDDYRATVLCGANSEGDSDSIACIAGAISGAYNGLDAVPVEWRERVEHGELLRDLATRLYHRRSPLTAVG